MKNESIAIVGVAFRFPGDLSSEADFWQALAGRQDLVTEIPANRWAKERLQHPQRNEPGKSVTFAAGVLSRIDEFDAEFFGISPREAVCLDPQQRLLLELAWEAMENSGTPASHLAGSDCAVYVGISAMDYANRSMDDISVLGGHSMTGNTLSIAANRLSYVFDLHGPSLAVDTACSSSLVALHHACAALRAGEASTALAGGINMLLHPHPFVGFTKASMLSADGRCKTFDASGDGYVRGEGGAIVLLKPLRRAVADGDRIHAVIRGSGVNADGNRKTGLTIPSIAGQVELMRQVLARNGLDPAAVDYLEAHGTGTAIGDPVETAAIGAVYGQARAVDDPLPIGSVKTNLGHLEPASGMAGLIKAMLVLKHREVPPSLHFETPNPKIDFAGWNLHAVSVPYPLADRATRKPLLVGINSFGFGGANAHVLLEEYRQEANSTQAETPTGVPLILSARSVPALRAMAAAYASRLAQSESVDLYDFAWCAAHRRDWLEQRLVVRADDQHALARALQRYAENGEATGVFVEEAPAETAKLAFVYAGNGSQWIGMGQMLLAESPRFRQLIEELEAPVMVRSGISLIGELMTGAENSRLDDTGVAQPTLFAIQYALTVILREQGVVPDFTVGHSVGEIAAAWAAGSLTRDEAVRVICARSAAQSLTRGTGRMAAIAMSEEKLRSLLAAHGLTAIEIAGINSPQNLTVSGPLVSLEQLSPIVRAEGAAFRLLDLDYAFHSAAMDATQGMLLDSLADLSPLAAVKETRFHSTVTGAACVTTLDASYWWKNIRQPVRFADAIASTVAAGATVFVEISPNAILQRYLKECLAASKIKGRILPSLRKNDDGLDRFEELLLRLQVLGGVARLSETFPVVGRFVELPLYPWQRERYWQEQTLEGYRLIERDSVHPLLGWPLKDAQGAWENLLDPRVDLWLNEHRVGGAIVLPGAAYVEMALAASQQFYGGDSIEIEQLDIVAPVVFDENHGRSIRLELNPRDGSFQIRSRLRLSDDEWSLHAAGRLLGTMSVDLATRIPDVIENAIMMDRETHYRLASAIGLEYAGDFRSLANTQHNDTRLAGEFLPVPDDAGWLLQPGQLDVCFQSLLDFYRQEIESGNGVPLLPVKVGRLQMRVGGGPAAGFRCHLRKRSLRSVLADFEIFDASGQCLARLSGCRFRAASLRKEGQHKPACWEIFPKLAAHPASTRRVIFSDLPAWTAVLDQVLGDRENSLRRVPAISEALPLLDALVTAFAVEAMAGLLRDDPCMTASFLAGEGFANDEQRQLFNWVRRLLERQELLDTTGDQPVLDQEALPSPAEIWRMLLAEYPDILPKLVLVAGAGKRLADVLAGRADASAVIAATSRSTQWETLYDESLTYVASRVACESLIVEAMRQRDPTRQLRVLEIAAGATTIPRQIATAIDVNEIDYCIAHVDPDIRDRLVRDHHERDWVQVVSYDADTPRLDASAMEAGNFDLILLRHTLSSNADPRAMVAMLREVLAVGGMLVISERVSDPAMELLEAGAVRPEAVAWQTMLDASGFSATQVWYEPATAGSVAGCYLLLAQAGEKTSMAIAEAQPASSSDERWLLVVNSAQAEAMAAPLQAALTAAGRKVTVESGWPASLPASEAEHIVWLFAPVAADDTVPTLELFECVRQLVALPQPPQLHLLLSGGAPVDGLPGSLPVQPAHAAVWGLSRVIMNEMPGISLQLIDCPMTDDVGLAARLCAELTQPDGESEIVLRAEGRHVLRMRETRVAAPCAASSGNARYRLDFRVPGQLRNLLWLDAPERVLGGKDIEVVPKATGLNFRDVMYVMGLLPDEAVENGFAGASLGLEFSGVVNRIGADVTGFKPGDAVMGFGAACFASHVVTREDALMPIPDGWTFASAATVPTVFFTVYYALKELARLQPGERVLIHGAAGGVGIAAVQFARHLGAEIYATAGSDEKRLFVELLGADHVLDSRSLAFAEDILALTNGEGIDVVLNSLAGEAIRRNLQILRPFGRFLELGKRDFFENTPIGLRPFKDNISYFGIDADQLLIARPALAARLFGEVMALFRDGVLTPLPARVFPAEQVVDAFRYMQQARQIGKVVVSFERARISPQPLLSKHILPRFDPHGTYLITGGVGGFGLETARWLAAHGAGQVVLLSRQGLAAPGAAEAQQALEALGAQVRIVAGDVADRAVLAQLLTSLDDLPPLKGVFHAAMVIDDALLGNLDGERISRVLDPKIKGAWNLHELTSHCQLDHFVLYSSITTSIGNPGQGAYVAANTWLEALAILRREQGLPATCIGWGPIGDAGYLTRNQAVKDSLASRLGAAPLAVGSALNMLGEVLAAGSHNLALADFHWPTLARLLPSSSSPRFVALRRNGDEVGSGPESLDDFRSLIEGKSPEEVRLMVRSLVTQEVAQTLAINPERIDSGRSLHDLGLDSLMGVELALGLEKRFGVQVPAMMLNEGPTVDRVSERIIERLVGNAGEAVDLASTAAGMAVQHAVDVAPEVIEALVADIRQND